MFSTLNTEEFLKNNITVTEYNLSLEGKKFIRKRACSDESTTDSHSRSSGK